MPDLPRLTVERTSTVQQAAQALRSAILQGSVPPAAPLREIEVAEALSVSRGTAREAIRLLVTQGLATHHIHRGATVVRLDEQDVADIYGVRRVLELTAIETADAKPEQLAQLQSAVEELEEAAYLGDPQISVEKDLLFHRRIVALLGNRRLNDFFANIQNELHLCLSIITLVDKEYLRAPDIAAEHRAIFEALVGGRLAEAARLMRQHLDTNGARLEAILRTRNQSSSDGTPD